MTSCLADERAGMRRAMLEVVANGSVSRPDDIKRYLKCTLLAAINHEKVHGL